MTPEKINELKEQIENSNLSAAEKLNLLKELNTAVEGLREDLSALKN